MELYDDRYTVSDVPAYPMVRVPTASGSRTCIIAKLTYSILIAPSIGRHLTRLTCRLITHDDRPHQFVYKMVVMETHWTHSVIDQRLYLNRQRSMARVYSNRYSIS